MLRWADSQVAGKQTLGLPSSVLRVWTCQSCGSASSLSSPLAWGAPVPGALRGQGMDEAGLRVGGSFLLGVRILCALFALWAAEVIGLVGLLGNTGEAHGRIWQSCEQPLDQETTCGPSVLVPASPRLLPG